MTTTTLFSAANSGPAGLGLGAWRALVVNCSAPHYNLGAAKLSDWLRSEGHAVTEAAGDPGMFALGYDLVALSVIFSWHAPIAREIALRVKSHAAVWAGGPGLYALHGWWEKETGLKVHRGLDQRFDRQRGEYRSTFASRGCPVGCAFCIVPSIEGSTFSFDPDFQPAPTLSDNNLSALPVEYQEHIIRRYRESGIRLEDAESGFEPRAFDEGTYRRWSPLIGSGPWRFALDEMVELEDVRLMMALLSEVRNPRRKRVYVLAGNEPFEACYERAQKVLEWGGEPWVQPVMRLNTLEKRPWVRHDWTERSLRDFARYYNRRTWKYARLAEYSNRKGEAPPFAGRFAA